MTGRKRPAAAALLSALAVLNPLAPPAWADGTPAPAAGSLCSAGETRYFSCATRHGRQLALCGSAAGVQYRYGRNAAALELAHPPLPQVAAAASSAAPAASAAGGAPEALRFAHYARPQTERYEVVFVRQGTRYAVFDYREDGVRSAGVQVSPPGRGEIEIACRGHIHSRLPELEARLPCDADNALNLGRCR